MRKCRGFTSNLRGCAREGDWLIFCHDHKYQWILWLSFLVFTVGGGTASILGYIDSDNSQVISEDTSNKKLASNAFKAGYSFSKVFDSPKQIDSDLWMNRLITRIEALGLPKMIIGQYLIDKKISTNEMILLRDDIKTKLEVTHGKAIADTYIIGADLELTINTFTKYLSDLEYRSDLKQRNIDGSQLMMELGSGINQSISDAILPKPLKKEWVSIYGRTIVSIAYPSQMKGLNNFKENIIRNFYE